VAQIDRVILFLQAQTSIRPTVRTQIITQLRSVRAVLTAGHTATAITQLKALRTRIQASSFPAPPAVKQAIAARLTCIIATLSR
jgi:hypothetical protein